MQMQLQEYFQNTLPKHSLIEQRISPLLNRVKHRHINSIHQLNQDISLDLNINPKTRQASEQNPIRIFTFKSCKPTAKPNKNEEISQVAKKSALSTLQVEPRRLANTTTTFRHNPEERTIFMSPMSKVKRHLIEYLDFNELQAAMYRESGKQNVFQQFCQIIREKNSSLTKKRALSHQGRFSVAQDTEQDSQVEDLPFPKQEYGFRVTTRKKFWKAAGQKNGGRKMGGGGYLTVKGLLGTIN